MLDPLAPTYSPGSRRLIDMLVAGEKPALVAEVRRTLDGLAAGAPARIASGRSTQREAEAVLFLWLAIAEDLEADDRDPLAELAPKLAELRLRNGVAWSDKVEALRREIGSRRALYPDDVGKGRLTADQAKQQIERLEAVHDLYWRLGFAFDGTRDELRAFTAQILDQDVAEQGAAPVPSIWNEHGRVDRPSGDSSTVEHSADPPTAAGSNPAPRSNAGATA